MNSKPTYEELEQRVKALESAQRKSERQVKALKKSERNLAMAQKVAATGSWDWDIEKNLLTWSAETYRQFGLNPDEIVPTYERFEEFIHPEDKELVNEVVRQALKDGKKYLVDARMISHDGREWVMRAQGTVYKDCDGKAIRFIGTQQDITKRKQLEKELKKYQNYLGVLVDIRTAELTEAIEQLKIEIEKRKETEKNLQNMHAELEAIFNAIPDALVFADLDRKITKVNPGFTKVYGYTQEEVYGQKTQILYTSEEEFQNQGKKRFNPDARDMYDSYEIEYRKKNGDIFLSETVGTPVTNEQKEAIGLIGIIRDITKRKQAEERLKLSHERFKVVMDSLDALVYVADMNTYEILFINQYGQDLLGEVVGKICWQTLHTDQTGPCEFCTNNKLLDNHGFPNPVVLSEFQKTANNRWYECRDQAIKWPSGTYVRLEIATDITERKNAENKLKRTKESLREAYYKIENEKLKNQVHEQSKLASLGQLATGIAHEINQPLSYVRITFETLLRDIANDQMDLPEVICDSHEALKQISRISTIIDHLRLFGRDEGTIFCKVDLKELVENALILMRQQMSLKNVKYNQVIPTYLPAIRGNAIQLEQVLINLFQNSIDAMLDGPDNLISFSAYHENNKVKVEIIDNGEGIPYNIQEKIFEPFFTSKQPGKGTGIGLSIVYGIIKDHKGDISYDQIAGGGSKFSIELPILN